ncbi:MAG: hypothetical protein BroJett040_12880 [Oligoflexia bacterium]|nr:MAG: hypothetical protein BroJett040_12880 [Oligoflexia bacterium]
MTQPLPIQNKLAGNPSGDLQFAIPVQTKDGVEINLADPRATRALVALMDMNAVMGGAASHYGGPAAFAELMSALHGYAFYDAKKKGQNWYELYNLINDAGHCENGLYALKANYGFAGLKLNDLKGFRSIESRLTGHGESHLFPEAVLLSNGPLGSALPQSQGLAMADALAGKSRVTVTAISDGACMEGEAREAMAAIPGLAARGQLAPFVMIISDNNTKLSGRIDKESYSMGPSFQALATLGWKLVKLEDGHDLRQCFDVVSASIEEVRQNPKVPIAIHAKTIKGIGTKKTAESSSGGHGFPLKSPTELGAFLSEIYDGQSYPALFNEWIDELIAVEKKMKAEAKPPAQPEEKIQKGISAAMVKAKKAGLPVISITSDLPGSTGTAEYRKEFPHDSYDLGIAESNMVSAAAGFSKCGYIPVVDTFAQFGVTKGALPLTMASISEAPIICVYSHTGFQDAADGASHQALTYLSMTNSIPHCDVYCLTCSEEAEALMTQALHQFADARKSGKVPRSTIFFLGRENFPKNFVQGATYDLNKAQILHDSSSQYPKSVTVLASGSLVPQAMQAVKELEAQKVGVIVVNPGNHNRPDLKTITACVEKTQGRFITVEDHQAIGGLGHLMTAEITQHQMKNKVRILGVHDQFGQSAYNAIDLYKKHNIDASSIVRNALELAKS